MKKLFAILVVVSLTACTGQLARNGLPQQSAPQTVETGRSNRTPAQQAENQQPTINVPALPDSLERRPRPLPPLIDATPKGIMRDGAQTDTMYNDLASRYNAMIRFYNCVRDAVNNQDSAAIRNCS